MCERVKTVVTKSTKKLFVKVTFLVKSNALNWNICYNLKHTKCSV